MHKLTSQLLAIKQVPVDTDLQEIIKEISIMQQCDSPYVVKYYGSYFKNSDLWVRIFKFLIKINFYIFCFLDRHGILRSRVCFGYYAFAEKDVDGRRDRDRFERYVERLAISSQSAENSSRCQSGKYFIEYGRTREIGRFRSGGPINGKNLLIKNFLIKSFHFSGHYGETEYGHRNAVLGELITY